MSESETRPSNPDSIGVGLPPEQLGTDPPRIYVASLSDYNAGRLHGAWLDAVQEVDELQAGITAMLAESTEPVAEEWAIHDYDGFSHVSLGEFERLDRVSSLARGIAEHGEAFAAWWANTDPSQADVDELSEQFLESYRGEWDSLSDFAETMLDDMGAGEALQSIPDWLQPYVSLNIELFARDLELGGDIHIARSGSSRVFVFDQER